MELFSKFSAFPNVGETIKHWVICTLLLTNCFIWGTVSLKTVLPLNKKIRCIFQELFMDTECNFRAALWHMKLCIRKHFVHCKALYVRDIMSLKWCYFPLYPENKLDLISSIFSYFTNLILCQYIVSTLFGIVLA